MCEIRKVLIGGSVTIVFVHCALFSASQRLVLSGLQWIFGICKNIFSRWERFSMQHFVSEGRSCIISEDNILTLIPQMTWPWWSFSIVVLRVVCSWVLQLRCIYFSVLLSSTQGSTAATSCSFSAACPFSLQQVTVQFFLCRSCNS